MKLQELLENYHKNLGEEAKWKLFDTLIKLDLADRFWRFKEYE